MTPMPFGAPTHPSSNWQHTNQQPTTTQRNQVAQLGHVAPVRVYSGPAVNRLLTNNMRQSTTSTHLGHDMHAPQPEQAITAQTFIPPEVETYSFNLTGIGDAQATTIMKTIFSHPVIPTFIEIDFSNNYVGCDFAKKLAELLIHNCNRIISMKINLSHNFIGDEGAKALADAIAAAPASLMGLQIDASQNEISEDGLNALGEATKNSIKKQNMLINQIVS